MIDDLNTWKTTYLQLQNIGSSQWAQQFSNWVDERVSGKMELNGVYNASGTAFIFVFNKNLFKSELLNLQIVNSRLQGVTNFANAWKTAVLGSSVQTLVNSYIGINTPATRWSVINSTTLNSAGVNAAYNIILTLANEEPTDTANSKVPQKLREAFLSLTVDTQGVDSRTPPQQLNDYNRSVL
jgi:hypothetical protein